MSDRKESEELGLIDELTLRLSGRPIHTFAYIGCLFFILGGVQLLNNNSGRGLKLPSTFFAASALILNSLLLIYCTVSLLINKKTRKTMLEKHPMYGLVPISNSSRWLVRLLPFFGLVALCVIKMQH